MNKYVIELINGAPLCTVTKSDKTSYTMEGAELIKFLGRIDEALYGRKERINPLYDKKGMGPTLCYINRLQKKNIRLRNYKELIQPLRELYLENRKEIRAEDKQKSIIKGAAATAVMIGGLALASMGLTSNKDIDLETVATYQETIEKESTKELEALVADIIPMEEINISIEEDKPVEDIQLNEEEIQSISDSLVVDLNVDAVYDKGIENNLENIEDIIHERAQRWGLSDSLVRDIISQESHGGSIDNIGQLEWSYWDNHPITLHNYETNKDVTIVFSNEAKDWQGKADIIISQEDLKNTKTQVSEICILMRYFLDKYDNNIGLAIQAYNRGEVNVNQLLAKTAEGEGTTVDAIVSDKDNFSWIDYSWKDENGLTYLEEVAKHVSDREAETGLNEPYEIKYIDADGNVQTTSIQFQLQTQKTL